MFKRRKAKKNTENNVPEQSFAGIPAEVVAAITGAVYMLCGADTQLKTIRPAASRVASSGRSAWSMAGLLENTRPF